MRAQVRVYEGGLSDDQFRSKRILDEKDANPIRDTRREENI